MYESVFTFLNSEVERVTINLNTGIVRTLVPENVAYMILAMRR